MATSGVEIHRGSKSLIIIATVGVVADLPRLTKWHNMHDITYALTIYSAYLSKSYTLELFVLGRASSERLIQGGGKGYRPVSPSQ